MLPVKGRGLSPYFRRYKKYIYIGIIIGITSTFFLSRENNILESPRDYHDIHQEGILRVTTEYGANSYYIDENDSIAGFYYSLINEFAKSHGLKLEIIPEMSIDIQNQMLRNGKCDIIANGRLMTTETKQDLLYTIPIAVDRQMVVQRIPHDDEGCAYLKSQLDLAEQTICIPKGSPFKYRVHNLIQEIGDTIYIQEIEKYSSEQIMAMVAHGDFCYAICEEEIVRANIDKYPQLDNSMAFSFSQFYSWAVNKESPALLDSLNAWLERNNF